MTETILDRLIVEIRADASPLKTEVKEIKSEMNLLENVSKKTAHSMTRAFEGFAKTGKFNFDSLKNTALLAFAEIASSALTSGINSLFGSGGGGSLLGSSPIISGLNSIVSGLFGRATGGAVSASQPYMIGERGPELFIPQNAGRIIGHDQMMSGNGSNKAPKTTNIMINISNSSQNAAETRKSAGQIAVAVKRAADKANRDL